MSTSWRISTFLKVIDAGDCLLLELQSRLREIASRPLSGKPNQVFIDYCHRSLNQALNVAKDAAQRGELKVSGHHFDTVDTVMGAFQGCQDRTYRCVWLIEDGDLFDDSWRKYMKCLVELSRIRSKAKQVQVRILFVVDDDLNDQALLKRRSLARALGFVSGERKFKCRLIWRRDYEAQLCDAGLSNQCLDFGVYGDHLTVSDNELRASERGRVQYRLDADPELLQGSRSCDGLDRVACSALEPAKECVPRGVLGLRQRLVQSPKLLSSMECEQ